MKQGYWSKCYYCGSRATSREHVPPKQMFRAFPCDSITVPSCETHNSAKSGRDQAIVSSFLIPIKNRIEAEKYKQNPLSENITRAIDVADKSFERSKRLAISSPLIADPPQALQDHPNTAFLFAEANLPGWIRQLTAALVYHGTRHYDDTISWELITTWSANWIESRDGQPLKSENIGLELAQQEIIKDWFEGLLWLPGWSAHPRWYPADIYHFQVHLMKEEIIFRHRFYNQYTWYAWFFASSDTIQKLERKLLSLPLK